MSNIAFQERFKNRIQSISKSGIEQLNCNDPISKQNSKFQNNNPISPIQVSAQNLITPNQQFNWNQNDSILTTPKSIFYQNSTQNPTNLSQERQQSFYQGHNQHPMNSQSLFSNSNQNLMTEKLVMDWNQFNGQNDLKKEKYFNMIKKMSVVTSNPISAASTQTNFSGFNWNETYDNAFTKQNNSNLKHWSNLSQSKKPHGQGFAQYQYQQKEHASLFNANYQRSNDFNTYGVQNLKKLQNTQSNFKLGGLGASIQGTEQWQLAQPQMQENLNNRYKKEKAGKKIYSGRNFKKNTLHNMSSKI